MKNETILPPSRQIKIKGGFISGNHPAWIHVVVRDRDEMNELIKITAGEETKDITVGEEEIFIFKDPDWKEVIRILNNNKTRKVVVFGFNEEHNHVTCAMLRELYDGSITVLDEGEDYRWSGVVDIVTVGYQKVDAGNRSVNII